MTAKAVPVKKISPDQCASDLLRRLDLKGNDPSGKPFENPTEIVLYDIFGTARGFRQGSSDKGPWTSFRGEFKCVREDGKEFLSGACFVPQPMEDMIFGRLQALQTDPDVSHRAAGVDFALRVSIVPPRPGKPSATGYEYKVVSHIEAELSDPMKQLEARVQASIKALPKPGETSADKPATVAAAQTQAASTAPTQAASAKK